MHETCFDSEADRAALVKPGGPVVGSSQRCPVCGGPMSGRKTSACSDRCRARKSRLARVPLPVTEAREIKASLTMILDTAWQIRATLERYGG